MIDHSPYTRKGTGANAVLLIHGIAGSPGHFRDLTSAIPESFSVYNILCRHNEMAYKMRINEKGVAYTPATMPFTFLPSLSYYYKF